MMQTRCPACNTHFRVTSEQLKARHGRVRCGKCQHIFDALETLFDNAVAVVHAKPGQDARLGPLSAPVPSASTSTSTSTSAATAQEGVSLAAPALSVSDAATATATATTTTTTTPASLPADEPRAVPEAAGDKTVDLVASWLHEDEAQAVEPQRRAWPWLLASLLALLVLGLQTVVQFRVELAVLAPEMKPALRAVCDVLGCDLSLPRHADQLSIETSNLHPDPHNKKQLILDATLKNRAPYAQVWPHLELTLTDTMDQPLLRKIIAPIDYLPKGGNLTTGFAPGAEIAVALALIPDSTGKAAPSGYRLYLFHP